MKVVIQRVTQSSVRIDGLVHSAIGRGLLLLLGIEDSDTQRDIDYLARKIANLRIFADEAGVMNLSVKDTGGDILAVSQFTLLADTRKGNRPSYIRASKPDFAVPVYEKFCRALSIELGKEIKTGVFAADMQVELVNDGPVTIIINSELCSKS